MGILDYMNNTGVSTAAKIRTDVSNTAGKVGDWASEKAAAATSAIGSTISKAVMPDRSTWAFGTVHPDFNNTKYSTTYHSYPDRLLDEEYGGNYAVFYINISDASALKLTEDTVELDPDTEARQRGDLVANANKLTNTFDSAFGTINKGLSAVSSKTGVDVGNINVDAIKQTVPFNGRSQRRLSTAISLHMPNQLSVRYATQWGVEENTAAAQALMSGANSGANAVGAALTLNGSALGKNLTDLAANAIEFKIADKMSKSPYAGVISAATGTTANPKKEQTFKGVEYRSFTFDYQFYPRDEYEAENVLRIIHAFKLHMHPEFKSALNYIWIYPSEFDIVYYTQHVENTNIHKHTSCILENMTVNYTPNGNFSVFKNGMPTQINMSLEFKELQLASKETIGLAYGLGL